MAISERLIRRFRLPLGGGWLLRIGAGIVAVFVLVTLLAPWLAPYDPISYQDGGRLAAPSAAHWLGTDALGRDIFSRLLYGGRIPLETAVVSAAFAIVVGSATGWISGYTGGWFDRAFSLVMDSIYSFPSLILAIMIAAVLGPGLMNMVIAVSLIYVPTYFRVARSETLKVREEEYVMAAQAIGTDRGAILRRHVAPNTTGSILAVLSFNIADAILTEAGLSFLGLGIAPPTPDWGFDLQNGQTYMASGSWWPVTFPGLAILALVYGFGLLGEAVADLINPRRRA